jgi:hypothetical protein
VAITVRQIDDRLRRPDGRSPLFGDYDQHVQLELAEVLGEGPATIRTGPATFARVDNLGF